MLLSPSSGGDPALSTTLNSPATSLDQQQQQQQSGDNKNHRRPKTRCRRRKAAPKADDGRHAPRPLRRDCELGEILVALEVPDCKCPSGKFCLAMARNEPGKCPGKAACKECPPMLLGDRPCRHALEAGATAERCGVTLDEWHALMVEYDREGMLDPPPAPSPLVKVTREAHVAASALRCGVGVRLYHPDDVLPETHDRIGVGGGLWLTQEGGLGESKDLAACPKKASVVVTENGEALACCGVGFRPGGDRYFDLAIGAGYVPTGAEAIVDGRTACRVTGHSIEGMGTELPKDAPLTMRHYFVVVTVEAGQKNKRGERR